MPSASIAACARGSVRRRHSMRFPRTGEPLDRKATDADGVPIGYPVLIAMITAVAAGWLTLRHCRLLMHEGIGFDDGGGYAVLILIEFTVCMVAVAAALNLR